MSTPPATACTCPGTGAGAPTPVATTSTKQTGTAGPPRVRQTMPPHAQISTASNTPPGPRNQATVGERVNAGLAKLQRMRANADLDVAAASREHLAYAQ